MEGEKEEVAPAQGTVGGGGGSVTTTVCKREGGDGRRGEVWQRWRGENRGGGSIGTKVWMGWLGLIKCYIYINDR